MREEQPAARMIAIGLLVLKFGIEIKSSSTEMTHEAFC